MPQLKLKRGTSANLSNVSVADGQLIITTDTKEIYFDNDSSRIKLTTPPLITSVNGKTGAVSLNYSDVGAPSTTGTNASGTWGINISGNAATASKLATARTISLTGSVTGSGSFDGNGNLNINTTTNHSHSYLSGWPDTRDIATTPDDYNSKLKVVGIKNAGGSGVLDGSSYSTLVGIRGWSDLSGGNAHELAFTGNGSLYRRHGSTTSWNAWVKILDSGNYTDYAASKNHTHDYAAASHTHSYLPLSGGTMTGLLINDTAKVFGHHDCGDDISLNNVGWYNVGYSASMKDGSQPWWGNYYALCINNYWGIDIRTKDTQSLRHNGNRIWAAGDSVTGAVWNDYAEYRESDCEEFGYVLAEKGDDTLTKTTERLQPFAGVSSDTWGFCQGETEKAKTPIAVAGRVLVYTYQDRNNYKPGDVVCAAPDGTIDIMTREEVINYPDRIVGTVSCVPEYDTWGSGDRDPVKVDGRIWIKVK